MIVAGLPPLTPGVPQITGGPSALDAVAIADFDGGSSDCATDSRVGVVVALPIPRWA
ncbi:hypothetical protein [Nocardia ninae]|uniref:hypothetical protein n=1 Tax=Nocardia ninae TaxID=356145 RepID=UPI001649B1D1|nr:hypothetical protein [Nocardia ninae]